ncbi:MAG: IMP cyclohydrolase [Clostridia bacterium]|nr:IMP cyclohydrolase [Clostridia bacterium]
MGIYDINIISDLLSQNTYPGRGIVIGKTSDGNKAVFAYFIMGRSENSRNRVFTVKDNAVFTEPFDASKVEDPSLIIYAAVRKTDNSIIVTNGNQTDTIFDFIKEGKSFEQALETRCFEPDSPNWTPRISGLLDFTGNDFTYKMSILKSADAEGSACNRFTYNYTPINGLGHFIHTYNCDGNPIPTFSNEPERVAVTDDIDEYTNEIWNSLNEANKISLYVSYIDIATGAAENRMINKNK